MALKALMLRKKLSDAQKALNALTAKDAEFTSRESEIGKDSREQSATLRNSFPQKSAHRTQTPLRTHPHRKHLHRR